MTKGAHMNDIRDRRREGVRKRWCTRQRRMKKENRAREREREKRNSQGFLSQEDEQSRRESKKRTADI